MNCVSLRSRLRNVLLLNGLTYLMQFVGLQRFDLFKYLSVMLCHVITPNGLRIVDVLP